MAAFQVGSTAIEETESRGVVRYVLDDIRIYRVGVRSVARFVTNVYLIVDAEVSLVDVGFYTDSARVDLKNGLATINRDFNELVTLCHSWKTLYTLTDEYYRHHPEFIGAPSIRDLTVEQQCGALEEIKAHVEYLLENERMMVDAQERCTSRYRSGKGGRTEVSPPHLR